MTDSTQPTQPNDSPVNQPTVSSNTPDVSIEIQPVTTAAESLLNLESMIQSKVRSIDLLKDELKKYREMLESTLLNDETYRLHNEAAKQAVKIKSATKTQILKLPQNAKVALKAKDLSQEIKELGDDLVQYLQEYTKLSGTNEIEGSDGEVREIVYIPKLIRKSSYQAK